MLEAVAGAFEGDDFGVVDDAVDHDRGDDLIANESVFDTLKSQLTLENHGGRNLEVVKARVAVRLLATGIWHNWLTGAPRKRSLIAYDH